MRVVLALVFVAVLVAFFALGGHEYLTLETIKAHRDTFLAYTQSHYAQAVAIVFVLYTALTAFSVPGGSVLSLAVGFILGRWVGLVLVTFAATIGAALLFLAARYILADAVRRRLGVLGERINAGFTEDAFHYMLFLRLAPAFPFLIVNLAAALTSIPLRTFVLATFIGVIPSTFVFVNLGETLGRIDSLQSVLSWQTFGALALLGVLALVPVVVRKARRRAAR